MCVRFKLLLIVTFFSFSGIVYSQAPGCPNVDAGPDQDLDCSTGDCADLSANFLETGSTTSYTVTSIPYAPPFGFFGGTQVSANTDDVWSPVINLPFTFCFYGNTYTQAIVGSNGVVSFDVSNAGGFCPYSFSSQIPDSNFPILNAIYGVYMDIDPRVQNSQGQIPQINYSVLGTAPCRTLVINYPQVPYFSCNSQELTSQIVLYETTNVVEVYTRQRTSGCSFNQGNALIGIQNASGTQAVAAPGRNTSDWAASFEAWRFTPSGPPNYVFSWLDSGGNVLSNNRDYTHCVTAPETLTAEVVYTNCDGTVITETDTVFIDYDANVTLDLGPDQDVCDNQVPITLDGTVSVAATYQWFENNVAIPGATNPTYDVTTTGTYRVEVDANGCDVSDQVDVNVSTVPDVFPVPTTSVCDDQSNDGVESFDLTSNDAVVLGGQDPNQFSVTYHISQADADNAANSLTSPYQNTSNPQVIFARVENTNNIECYNTTSFQIEVLTSPVANQANDLERCDDAGNDDVDNWDLTVNEADILGAQNPADFSLSYHLSQTDADNGAAAIATPTAYQNTANPQTIYVRVENVNDATCVATITFDLVLFDQPTANPVADEAVCDDQSNNGTEDFDLDTYTADVLGAQDPNLYTVSYHNTQADADTGSNALTSPYANVASPETIFVRIVNANNPDCYDTTSFQIEVLFTPIANQSSDLERCDDMGNDDVDTWDLTVNEADILGAQNPADFSLSYHLSQADADNGTAAIATPTAYQNTANPQTIYVRVENVNDATCVATTTFDLVLFDQPTANPVANVAVCDDQSNDGTEDFDLDAYTADVLGAQDPNLYTVSYHNTQADADTGSNALPSPYANVTSPETIFVRIVNANNPDCFDTTSFQIEVLVTPVANQSSDLERCDDAGNDDVDTWDLTVNEADILGAQNPADFSLSYHLSQADADNGTAAIAAPANFNNTSNPQTIYVRVENVNDATCVATTSFDLILFDQPTANPVANVAVCDDQSNDGTEDFDLDAYTADVLGAQDPNLYTVSYHNTQADADTGSNTLTSPYANTSSPEAIFVRIANNDNPDCFDTTNFDITVNPVPVANATNDLERCDDAGNDDVDIWDLTVNEGDILGAQNPADFSLSYHLTQNDADSGNNAIASPANFSNTSNPQTIYVRVENNSNEACQGFTSFDLILYEQAVASTATNEEVCDDEGNTGVATFDLSLKDNEIRQQDPNLFMVEYFASQADADAGTNPLSSPYTTSGAVETIYARVTNMGSTECYDTTSFDLIINPLPDISDGESFVFCDDLSDDGTENVDISDNETTILNGLDPSDFTITYYDDQQNAEDGTGDISPDYDLTVADSPVTIFVRVENNATGCFSLADFDISLRAIPSAQEVDDLILCDEEGDETAGFALSERNADITGGDSTLTVTYHASLSHAVDGTSPLDENSYQNTTNPEQVFYRVQDEDACFNVGDFELFVQPLPTIFSMDNLEQCVDENGEAEFDLSVAGDQAVGSQTDVTASYYLTESDAREEVNAVSTPFTAMEDTEIFIRVEFDDTGCAAVDSFMALAFPLPPASLENEYVFCTDQFGNFIVGPAELDTGLRSARYDLTWFFEEEEIVGEDGVLLEATEAGVYSVDIINTDTGCAITLTTTVREAGAPDDYTIEIQNGGATDNRTVIVEAIGPDEYWYRLDNGPYVNTGRFEDVRPGTHTITIAERNGCAEIQEEIFILGFPQFFTPNGDGFNDFWNVVEGGELDEASLYIFDRYGKLIKQIDPRSVGWDGTYNGNPLPSSDYWFLLEYRDGDSTGELRGHFALKR